MAHCQRTCCVTPSSQVHEKVSYEIMQSHLTRQVQGCPLSLHFQTIFHFSRRPQVWSERVKRGTWYLKETASIQKGLIDRAGAVMLCTLRDFHGSRLLQGHIPALLDLVRIDWWRDRLQIDDGVAGAAASRYSSQTPKWLWQFAAVDQLCDIVIYSVR